jgi:hypothetical protein
VVATPFVAQSEASAVPQAPPPITPTDWKGAPGFMTSSSFASLPNDD